MFTLEKTSFNEVQNWLIWFDMQPADCIPEAYEAFNEIMEFTATLTESEYYIVKSDHKDTYPKNMMLLQVKEKDKSLNIRFCRLFHKSKDHDHYENAARWFRTALTELLNRTKADRVFLFSKINQPVFGKIGNDILNNGFISNQNSTKAIFMVKPEKFGALMPIHTITPTQEED